MIYGIWLSINPNSFRRIVSPKLIQTKNMNFFITWLQTPIALWLSFFIVYNAFHLASWAGVRYRLPTDTVLVIFAAVSIENLTHWFQPKLVIPEHSGQINSDR
jgi:hypothetical protein